MVMKDWCSLSVYTQPKGNVTGFNQLPVSTDLLYTLKVLNKAKM